MMDQTSSERDLLTLGGKPESGVGFDKMELSAEKRGSERGTGREHDIGRRQTNYKQLRHVLGVPADA
jgi:hypothetical protein